MVRLVTRALSWWMVLILYALVGLAPARGLVLCIGEDGHLAFELSTTDGACFDGLLSADPDGGCCVESEAPHDECGCSDLTIAVENPKSARAAALDALDRAPSHRDESRSFAPPPPAVSIACLHRGWGPPLDSTRAKSLILRV